MVSWREAAEEAKERAAQVQFAEISLEQVARWQEATAPRACCDPGDAESRRRLTPTSFNSFSARRWLSGARRHAQSGTEEPEELKLFPKGWIPYGADEERYRWGDRR
ncbi:hypothetical protein ABZ490_45415 [Streptomyces sp. NPDC005811]|uniref:hypothetical protein n=1 Tax=Streptomyces sp. NPDC005811 TaxID=3154565 RepID=UPI003405A9E4